MDVCNADGRAVPVVHAQGNALYDLGGILEKLHEKPCAIPDWVGVVTCCNVKDAVLIKQLKKNNIPFRNPGKDITEWKNALKPGLIVEGIEELPANVTHVLALDALDVALNGDFAQGFFDYLSYAKPVLFGATRNNSPDCIIDRVHDRDWRGAFRYLNAGTSFGPKDAMAAFYRMVEDAVEMFPDCEREQPLVRYVFDRCQSWVDFDWRCAMFQTLNQAFVEDVDGAVQVS